MFWLSKNVGISYNLGRRKYSTMSSCGNVRESNSWPRYWWSPNDPPSTLVYHIYIIVLSNGIVPQDHQTCSPDDPSGGSSLHHIIWWTMYSPAKLTDGHWLIYAFWSTDLVFDLASVLTPFVLGSWLNLDLCIPSTYINMSNTSLHTCLP